MAKANPKAWFPGSDARMSYKSVDKHARSLAVALPDYRPYFDTWREAHKWMVARADRRLKKAQDELKSAATHHAKVRAMAEPKQEGSESNG